MTELKPPHDPIEALGQAYELMLEESIQDLHKIEDKSAPVIHDLIANAKERLSAAGELSHEEAERIGEYLERDLVDVGRYLAETGRELKDWLGFETALIEDEFLLMLQQAADQTLRDIAPPNSPADGRRSAEPPADPSAHQPDQEDRP